MELFTWITKLLSTLLGKKPSKKIEDSLVSRLKVEEGFTPTAYWDYKQFTYGFGTPAPTSTATITIEEAEVELRKVVRLTITEYRRLFKNCKFAINFIRQEALLDMLFNLGLPTFLGFKTLNRLLKEPVADWVAIAEAARESKWYGQVGARAMRICHELEHGETL